MRQPLSRIVPAAEREPGRDAVLRACPLHRTRGLRQRRQWLRSSPMILITRAPDRWLFSTLLILSIVSFAVPHASQDDASDEFILFVSDRAFPSQAGICASCEDIYVMPPAGELPGVPNAIRLTAGSGVESVSYNSAGPDWSRAKKLIAFQSNRPT